MAVPTARVDPKQRPERNAEDARDKAWWTWRHYNPRQAEDPRTAWSAGADWAYRQAILDSVEFAGLEYQLGRLGDLLEARRIEREAINLVAEARDWPEGTASRIKWST